MKGAGEKVAAVIGISAALFAYFAFDLGRFLTLDELKAQQERLNELYVAAPASVIGLYMGIYILVAAFALPGAAILTLAGGAIFGLLVGTVVVSLASTIGATLCFWAARILLREAVQGRFGEKFRAMDRGIEKEGAFYLFSLRLIPVAPFFLVNLLMGLTRIRAATFFRVSQLGMLPGTLVYVNAGTQLGRIESPRDIVSVPLLLSFAALGLLPIAAKRAVSALRAREILKKYPRPARFDYNVVVIGAGAGGLVSSYIAALLKSKVALVEKRKMGGDCLNTGCVPSKALIRSAKVMADARNAKELGFREIRADFDFSRIMERVQSKIRRVAPHDSVERYSGLGVECILGEAKIVSPYEVRVGDRTLKTRSIIVAAGASPMIPGIPGLQSIPYRTAETVWEMRELPKRFLFLGGGPIGTELAQSFARFGSRVTLVERNPQLLGREDRDAAELITRILREEGVEVLTGHEAKEFRVEGGRNLLVAEVEGREVRIEFDEAMLALGRRANVSGLGLEELGIELTDRGTIAADDLLRTNCPNVYVCGDVAGPFQFTHFAAHQAWYASVNALFSPFKTFKADYRVIPWCTYTDPEVARVGLSEEDAREKGIPYELARFDLEELDRAIVDSKEHGFIKVLTEPGKDRILGATLVSAEAGELLSEFVMAMKNGIGLNRILGTIKAYPTLAEANKYVAGAWKRAHAPKWVFPVLEKFHAWRRG